MTCLMCAMSDAHQATMENVSAMSIEHLFYHCAQRQPDALRNGVRDDIASLVIQSKGQPVAQDWPYSWTQPPADDWRPPSDSYTCYHARWIGMECDFQSIWSTVERGIPVILGVKLHDALYRCGPSGRLDSSPSSDRPGLHAVLCVACRSDPEPSICLRNSWGIGWGDHGHAWANADFLTSVSCMAAILEPDGLSIWQS